MKIHSIVSEVWRDICSGTNRTILWFLTLMLLVTGILGMDISTLVGLQRQVRLWETSGAAINLIQSEGQVNPESCVSLSQTMTTAANKQGHQSEHATATVRPIKASGALKTASPITLFAMPSAPLDSFHITPSMVSVLRLKATITTKTGVWISSQLSETLHARPGDTLETDHGPMVIAAVFDWPQDSRDQRIAYAILEPSSSLDPFDECWALVAPGNAEASNLLTYTAISSPGTMSPLQIKQINNSLGSDFRGWEQFSRRASKYLTVALALAALLLGFISVRIRRIEIADNLHCGISKGDIWAIIALETLAWSLPALLSGSAILLLLTGAKTSLKNALVLLRLESPMLLSALLLAQVGLALALLPMKADRLFAFFKERR